MGQKPIKEEHGGILDHNYDGIKELDNSLPPWWLYGFTLPSFLRPVIY
ncbi:MAG: cbb3-type cytochrome c oxidase N-terminal domain-containing protein [Flavobacteriaceae bacterium]